MASENAFFVQCNILKRKENFKLDYAFDNLVIKDNQFVLTLVAQHVARLLLKKISTDGAGAHHLYFCL